ncbi:MAG TPA: NUDIX domain-containing protein [Bacteroidales bacterium]|nr:NUDIX domain-containing protein [Bacteroidales bacterium]
MTISRISSTITPVENMQMYAILYYSYNFYFRALFIKAMTTVEFYSPSFDPEVSLIYSVITARYSGHWILVRHHKRTTWEIPGGHIEPGETADEAASRELMEETGAVDFEIKCIATYSVRKNGETGYGRLYFAEVANIGPVPDTSEIAEIRLADSLPENLTHPDIQPLLFKQVLEKIK